MTDFSEQSKSGHSEITSIEVYDGLAEHFGGPDDVVRFSISVFDVARLSGHLCPSIVGAFLVTRAAVLELFPDTHVCERGLMAIDIPGGSADGSNGQIGNVMSFITGAWSSSGFGGLRGMFVRRNLLHFDSKKVTVGQYRFERLDNGKVVEVSYCPGNADLPDPESSDYALAWQERIHAILVSPDVIKIHDLK